MNNGTKAPHKRARKNAKEHRTNWPLAYRWAAMGTLVVYSATGSRTINVARAQDLRLLAPAPGLALQTQGNLPAMRFDIPAGPLDSVLSAFSKATGVTVSVTKSGMGQLPSPGVLGLYTVDQALEKLLAGTGLRCRFETPTQARLELESLNTSVEVTATVDALGASSVKYQEPILNTPQTVTAVPQELIQQQGATTLRDALRNVAGISLAAGEGGAQGDNLTIRGFTARNDLFIDGMRDFGSYYRDPFDTQEVEVLQGPSSVTFGRGSTGGVVNQASKAPALGAFISGDLDIGSDLTRRITLDLDQPLSKLGPGAAFRLNLMGDENSVAGRDVAENRRFGIAPSLALGLGTPTRWTFSYLHQTADDNPDYGIPWLFNGPAPVPHENYYGFRNGNYLRTYDDIATARFEHDVNAHVTIRDQARYANYVRDVLITEAQIATPLTLATPLSDMTVNRHEIGVNSVESFLDEQLDLTAKFDTGFIGHTLVAGVEAGRETSDPTRPTWTSVPTTSLLDPNPDQVFAGDATITSIVHTSAITTAAYMLDTMRLGKKWELTGGIRWDRFDTDYKQTIAPASAFHRIDEMPSWRAALVYKPAQMGSIYAAAGTSFNPSAESLSLTSSNADLPPEKNRTYEAGTKWSFPHDRLSLRLAVFRTDKLNAREPDPTNSLLNVLAGNQRVNGAEVDVRARLSSRWDLMASYADLDSRVVSSNYYPASVGAQLANVPRTTFNFWSTYRMPKRWQTGFGGNFVSSRTASSTAPYDPVTGLVKEAPGYWAFNAMARHPLAEHVDLQINLFNLANRYYYDELHPAHIVPGPGRSATASLRFKF